MNGKKDTVGELYKKVAQYDKVLKLFVFLNVVSALAESLTNFSFNEVLLVVEIISAVAVVIIRWLINYNFYYTAEKARNEYAMSDGYNVDLTLKKTEGYYTNSVSPSLKRYAMNILESNYYTMKESEKMIAPHIIKNVIIIALILIAMIKTSNISFILAGVQGIFTASIIENSISLIIYHNEMVKLYDSQYETFLKTDAATTDSQVYEAICIRNIVEYEVVKAYFKVQLDQKIYEKYRGEIANEWNEIEKTLNHKNV